MKTLNVAFDVDGTLINWDEQPNPEIVELIKFFHRHTKNCQILVWSRRGEEWAQQWVDALKLNNYVWRVGSKEEPWQVDIAFDDQHSFDRGHENVIVKLNEAN